MKKKKGEGGLCIVLYILFKSTCENMLENQSLTMQEGAEM